MDGLSGKAKDAHSGQVEDSVVYCVLLKPHALPQDTIDVCEAINPAELTEWNVTL